MYQGETAKYEIEMTDHMGNVIPKSAVISIDILIYRESTKQVYLKYSTQVKPGYSLISPDPAQERFYFLVTNAQTINLPLGTYIMKIESVQTDPDFVATGSVNIEEAALFTIDQTVKVV